MALGVGEGEGLGGGLVTASVASVGLVVGESVSLGVIVTVGVNVSVGVTVAVGLAVGFNARMMSRCIYTFSIRRVREFWSTKYHSPSCSAVITQTVSPSVSPSTILLLVLGSDRTVAMDTLTTKSWHGGIGVKLGKGVGTSNCIS